jgi:hypothetical protein
VAGDGRTAVDGKVACLQAGYVPTAVWARLTRYSRGRRVAIAHRPGNVAPADVLVQLVIVTANRSGAGCRPWRCLG